MKANHAKKTEEESPNRESLLRATAADVAANVLSDVMMLISEAFAPDAAATISELTSALAKYDAFPTDPLHAAAVLNEEVGKLNKCLLQGVYEPQKQLNLSSYAYKQCIQVAAMAWRVALFVRTDQFRFDQAARCLQSADLGVVV